MALFKEIHMMGNCPPAYFDLGADAVVHHFKLLPAVPASHMSCS